MHTLTDLANSRRIASEGDTVHRCEIRWNAGVRFYRATVGKDLVGFETPGDGPLVEIRDGDKTVAWRNYIGTPWSVWQFTPWRAFVRAIRGGRS